MKRKIALLLAVVMTLSLLPMNVFAISSNRVDKVVTAIKDQKLDEVPTLRIAPTDAVTTTTTIRLELENADWDLNQGDRVDSDTAYTWTQFLADVSTAIRGGNNLATQTDIENGLTNLATQVGQKTLPWSYELSAGNKSVVVLKLAPVTDSWITSSGTGSGQGKDSFYAIPLKATPTAAGSVKVTVSAAGTAISSGTYEFATSSGSSESGTVARVSEIKTQRDAVRTEILEIRETVRNSIGGIPGADGMTAREESIRLQLNGNFVFGPENKQAVTNGADGIYVSSDLNLDRVPVNVTKNNGDDTIEFSIPRFIRKTSTLDTFYISVKSGDTWSGLVIEPDDDDDDFGEIHMTIRGLGSNSGVTRQTLHVGTRQDFGFSFKLAENVSVAEILAGRVNGSEFYGNTSYDNGVDSDETEAAKILFKETIPNTWVAGRRLTFSVPEGVKISSYDFGDEEYFNSGGSKIELSKDGRSLHISDPAGLDKDNEAEFTLVLYLSAELGYTGNVPVSVSGGGIAAGTLDDVVVAEVEAPITIESSVTSMNLGYQSLPVADIKITEAVDGALIKGKVVNISIDSRYGREELGFSDDNLSYEIDGDMTITGFKLNKGVITFEVDRISKNGPSTITIKNVKVGSTRSVSYGGYDLLVSGTAFATNYLDVYADNEGITVPSSVPDRAPLFDDNEGYKFVDYIKVVTDTGTLDKVVKVTIGEKTALIDDVAVDIDVAAYIQTSSNSTMVPLRFVTLALGIDDVNNMDASSRIQWDPNAKTVTILYTAATGTKTVQFTAGSDVMKINGADIAMVSPDGSRVRAEITDSRMFVPFRALGDAFNVSVSWDADTRTAIYNQR